MADLTITAANVVAQDGATTVQVTAGGTVARGNPVYLDSADSNQAKAGRANAATTDEVYGIALNDAADEQPLVVITSGDLSLGAILTVGETYVLSAAAAGGIAPISDLTTGNYVTVLGIARTTSILQLSINSSGIAKP